MMPRHERGIFLRVRFANTTGASAQASTGSGLADPTASDTLPDRHKVECLLAYQMKKSSLPYFAYRPIAKGTALKKWIGRWVMFVALGHTVVGITYFGSIYRELLVNGLYNSITTEKAGLAVWFALFGVVLSVTGMLISELESNGASIPKSVGVALLLLTVLGVVLMPVSGFWLMIPAILAILLKKSPGVRPMAIE